MHTGRTGMGFSSLTVFSRRLYLQVSGCGIVLGVVLHWGVGWAGEDISGILFITMGSSVLEDTTFFCSCILDSTS